MGTYNALNYTEQGGEVTHIGGCLKIETGGSIEGLPSVANQAASTSATVAALKDDFNGLLTKLKDAGYMTPDAWPSQTVAKLQAAASEGHKTQFEGNMAKVTSVSVSGSTITVVADVAGMTAYESDAGYGLHKWIGILITTGFASIVGMKLNGTALTETDAADTTAHSGQAGDLVLYFPAETYNGKTFTLWHTANGNKTFTITITAAS